MPSIPPNPYTAPASAQARDARVDWLRGAAALGVLAHHLFAPFDWNGLSPFDVAARIAAWCWLGVPVFFVLSGRCVAAAWLAGSDARRFFLRRLRRIYPPYFASLLLCLAIILGRRLATGVNDVAVLPWSLSGIFATLTLTTAPVTTLPTINWVYWSLSHELAYYALLAALLIVPAGSRRLASWLSLHGILCACDLAGLGQDGTPLFFVRHWSLFGLGVGIALLASFRRQSIATFSICAVHLLGLAILGRFEVSHFCGIATTAALLLPLRVWSPRADTPLPCIGAISYSLYLVHVPIGVYLFLRPLFDSLGGGLLAGIIALSFATAGSLIAAWLFHLVAERPWMKQSVASAP